MELKRSLDSLDKELSNGAAVLFAQRHHGGVPHPHSSCQRRICFNDNVMPGARFPDRDLSVEGVHLDLVDDRVVPGLRGHELLDLFVRGCTP